MKKEISQEVAQELLALAKQSATIIRNLQRQIRISNHLVMGDDGKWVSSRSTLERISSAIAEHQP